MYPSEHVHMDPMWVLGEQRGRWASHEPTVWGPNGPVQKFFEHYFELIMLLQTQNYHFQLFKQCNGWSKFLDF